MKFQQARSIQFLLNRPNVSHNIKGIKHQKDTVRSLTKLDQATSRGNNEHELWQKVNKERPTLTEILKGR